MLISKYKLSVICINNGITLKELGQKAGVSSSTILNACKRPSKWETLSKVTKALGVDIRDIAEE